ncbi:MAG: hypothetical protein AAF357_11230 [Verrucomicrobiota bacterium]
MIVFKDHEASPFSHCEQFWDRHNGGFTSWWARLPANEKHRILTMPVDEVQATLHGKFDLRGAYSVVGGHSE